MNLRRLNLNLAILLLISILIHIFIFIYNYTVDDFVPKHIGTTFFFIEDTNIPDYIYAVFHQNPAYYGLIAVILFLTGILEYKIPLLPIVVIPYFAAFFALVYTLSGRSRFSFFLALLLTIFDMTSSLCGSYKIFLWPHGLGNILVYSYIILLFNMLKRSDQRFTSVGLIFIISLIFLSYNRTYYLLAILGTILLISFIKRDSFIFRRMKMSVLIAIVVLFGISKFIYNTFLPLFAEDSSFGFSMPINTFLGRFFSGMGYEETSLDQLQLNMPEIFTYIYIIKYALYILIILLGLIIVRKYINKIYDDSEYMSVYLKPYLLIYISTTIATILYMSARLVVGYFPLPEMFNILVFSFIVIGYISNFDRYNKNKIIPSLLVGVLVILIIINLVSMSIAYENRIIQRDNYDYIITSSNWLHKHHNGSAYFPDQLTYSWSFITYSKYFIVSKIPRYLPTDEVFDLYLSKSIHKDRLLVLNYRSNYNALSRGRLMKPFGFFREIVETNPSIKAKIYTYNDDLSIILT